MIGEKLSIVNCCVLFQIFKRNKVILFIIMYEIDERFLMYVVLVFTQVLFESRLG
jgi:hypothetical protein